MGKKKSPTKAERQHMAKVAAIGCIACRQIGFEDTPAEVHHIRSGVGVGQRNSHYMVIPLCPEHHRHGPNAIHRSKHNFELCFGLEFDLLAEVDQLMGNA